MPNFGYHLARAAASAVRRSYAAMLPLLVRRPLETSAVLPFEVYAYSGEAALPEQVASIRSFLCHAGRPQKFTVVSDGTYTPRSIELLRAIDPVVAIAQANEWTPTDVPEAARSYLTNHPTGKQLALIMSLPATGPALYTDSDVLFFPGAHRLLSQIASENSPARYLEDCQLSADERIFHEPAEKLNPVNTGVLFLAQKLDWSLSLERLSELEGAPTFFTNQTLTHLAMHAVGARPFDPRTFVLQLDDQFVYRDHYANRELALRHYVNPVRHKFWTSLWR